MKNIQIIIVLLAIILLNGRIIAQERPSSIDPVFIEIVEQNSTTLKAYQNKIDAAKQATNVGLTPSNPEVSYSYTKNGKAFGEELIVSQDLDFPTVYSKKGQMASIHQERLQAEYKLFRRNLITEAYLSFANYAYGKNMVSQSEIRTDRADEIFQLMQKRFDLGDISAIELSKAKMEQAIQQSNSLKWELYVQNAKKGLTNYMGENSGNEQIMSDIATSLSLIKFENNSKENLQSLWANQNDEVLRAQFDIQLSEKNVALKKAEALPSFSVGYRRDRDNVLTRNGFAAGVSIPLWEKKNTVKQAKAEQVFAESTRIDAQTRSQIEFERLFSNTLQNMELHRVLQEAIPGQSNLVRLKNTLEAGHISILDYYNQLAVFYELENQLESARNELNQSYIALYRIVL